jgi:Lipid A 3-O-deacylase (PagL)
VTSSIPENVLGQGLAFSCKKPEQTFLRNREPTISPICIGKLRMEDEDDRVQTAYPFVILVTVLLLLCYAPAQENSAVLVKKGSWDFAIWTAGATGEENRNSFKEAQIWTAGFSVGKVLTEQTGKGWLRGSLEYGFNLIPIFVTFGSQTVHGGGFEPVLFRWSSTHHVGRVVPYIELAGGAVFTNSNLPPGDTSSFNFTAKGGGGIHIITRPRRSFDLGCRWWHISNANVGVRNPEFNGLQVTLGYHWFR